MIWVDFLILGVVILSALISLVRGFVRESLSLAGWILAFWIALRFSEPFSELISPLISAPMVAFITAFAVLFLCTVILTAIVSFLAAQLVNKTGLSGTDRMVGVLFGAARGVFLVAVLVLLAGLTPLPQDPAWKGSLLLNHFQDIAIWMRGFLPTDLAQNFIF
ncbi:CvpA family protein [Ectothiorhodospiraceae bacterium 2226]|nr:CvpA family protein [Ectothiorhodospiraceae bacterium 2226]